MNTIAVYKHEIFNFLNSIRRLSSIIPEEIMEEIYDNNYQISGGISSIHILEEKGATIIKELKFDDLKFDEISLFVVTSGYARCPNCKSNEISYERFTLDGKGEWICHDCQWSDPPETNMEG